MMGSIFKLNLTALIARQRPIPKYWVISLDNFLLEVMGVEFKWLTSLEPQPFLTCRENFQLFLSLLNSHLYLLIFFCKQNPNFYNNSYYNFLTISLRLLLYTACLPHHSFNFYLESVCYFVVFPLFFPYPKGKHNNTISMTLERENRRNEKAKQARWV